MKSKKWMKKYILPENLTNKVFENALRMFETELTKPQLKSLKTVLRGLWKNGTTIISHIHEHTIETKKFIEKTSNHLWNMDIIKTVEKKAKLCIKKTIKKNKEEGKMNIIAYDESDIFKPDAKCMPWLCRIRDGSTGLTWNGYVIRWVNVNGISLYSHLEKADQEMTEKKRWEKTVITIKKIQKDLWRQVWLYLIDRGWDDIKVIGYLADEKEDFIIRLKKSRRIMNKKNGKNTKITDLKAWKHEVKIWGYDLILHVYKKANKKLPIFLLTNNEKITTKESVKLYLKRWKVEQDFKKMKELWLEEVRLLKLMKIQNLVAMIQFIIILSQDVYNKVREKTDKTYEHINLYFKSFCKRKSLTMNPTSFIKFISFSLDNYESRNSSQEPLDCLFWWKKIWKKWGLFSSS